MKLYKRPDSPFFWADLRRYGLGRRSTNIRDKRTAERYLIQFLAKNNIPVKKQGNLLELTQRYLVWSESTKATKVHIGNSYTITLFLAYLSPDMSLFSVSQEHIEGFIMMRAKAVSKASVNREYAVIRHMFNLAVAWEYLNESPCRKIKPFRVSRKLPKYYTEEEIGRLLKGAHGIWRSIWLILLNTGMRRGELLALKWSDLHNGALHIRSPKEGRDKVIPISEDLQKVLDNLPRKGEMVCPYGSSTLTHTFKKMAIKAGIPGNLHLLRHTTASHLLLNGVPLQVVQRILGHSSIAITDLYVHALDKDMKEAVDKLSFGTA